jgi:hypothetical protein
MACLLGIPKLQSTFILTPDCQPPFHPVLRTGTGPAGRLHARHRNQADFYGLCWLVALIKNPLTAGYGNSSTFENPAVADLPAAMSDPDQLNVSDTQKSMLVGASWHFVNIFWAAQKADDSGLLDDDLLMYQSSVAWILGHRPGRRTGLMDIFETTPWIRDMQVFLPLAEISCQSKNGCGDSRANQ